MILTTSSVKTERFTSEVAAILKACEQVNTFTESGWFFAYGWNGDSLVVKTHANSRDEYEAAMNPAPYWHNVKEHAPLSAGASVDDKVEVETTGEHENRADDRGCCDSTCSPRELREAFRAGCYRYRAGLGADLPPTSQRDMNAILRWSHDAYPDPEENS